MPRTVPVAVMLGLALSAGAAHAYTPHIEWSRTYDSGAADYAYGAAVDSSGNVAVNGTAGLDFWTMKFDDDGNRLWVEGFDGASTDNGKGIAVDRNGNIYVTGFSWNGSTFDMRLVKYSPAGTVLWADGGYDSGCHDWGYGVAVDSGGRYCVVGTSDAAGCSGSAFRIKAITKDAAKTLVWSNTFTSSGASYGYGGAAVDSAGNFYAFGISPNAGSGYDFRTIKYDSTGTEKWAVPYVVGLADINSGGIAVDASGNVYVAGYVNSGSVKSGKVVKYDSAGTEKWVRTISGCADVSANGVAVDGRGEVWVAVTANDGTYNQGAVFHYDAGGTVVWSATLGGTGVNGEFLGVAAGPDWAVYLVGTLHNGVDNDYRVVKLRTGETIPPSGPSVGAEEGSLLVAPNKLDLSAASSKAVVWLKGDAGGSVEVRIFDSAGRFVGTLAAELDSAGKGSVPFGVEGIGDRRLAPGVYWAVASGGGVSGRKKFAVVAGGK